MVTSRVRLRIVFGALVLLLPLTLAARKFDDGEPYPGLYLPNFGEVLEQGSAVEFDSSVIYAVLAGGDQVVLDGNEILKTPGGYSVTLGKFLAEKVETSPATEQWLRERLAAGYPDLDITQLSVVTNHWKYDETTSQLAIDSSEVAFTIDLGGAG